MSKPNHVRIVVKLHTKNGELQLAKFTECVLRYFGLDGVNKGQGDVQVGLKDNYLEISDTEFPGSHRVVLKHPSFCPIHHLTPEVVQSLPQEILTRGVDVGAAVVLESCDGHILLTRRAKHLHTFPGLWVPPGGHVEENETLLEAGLRELHEETGLKLSTKDCVGGRIDYLALWESVFPPKLSVGLPKRHHIVVYFHARLVSGLTATKMESQIKFDPGEVDACAWFDKSMVTSIVNSDDENMKSAGAEGDMPTTFRALIRDKEKQCIVELPFAPLYNVHTEGSEDTERVSTGTKFALHQYLHLIPAHSL